MLLDIHCVNVFQLKPSLYQFRHSLICCTNGSCKHWSMNLDMQQLMKQQSYSSFNALIVGLHACIFIITRYMHAQDVPHAEHVESCRLT